MKISLPGIILLLFAPLAHAGQPPTIATADGALRGRGPVICFTSGEPSPGRHECSTKGQMAGHDLRVR